jgi:Fe-S cluster assembly protein SufD
LVFINGIYVSELSGVANLSQGVQIGNLGALLDQDSKMLQAHLGRYVNFNAQAFVALNTAFLNEGAFIYLPKGVSLKTPIHLLFVTDSPSRAIVSYPRILVVAEENAQAAIVENYVGLSQQPYFTNAVTEVVLGENAAIEHYKFQSENLESFHVATLQVQQERHSHFTSHNFSFGGALVRNDLNVVLNQEGADCTLNGLYKLGAGQHVDNHTLIDHVKPHSNSRELYKGILDGLCKAIFNGKIIVRPNAQKTNASQTNKNLILSDKGVIHTKPDLEIFANDVKCKHGATIGQMDPEVLFYLRSRGMDLNTARKILLQAFANEMIEKIRFESIRSWIITTLG